MCRRELCESGADAVPNPVQDRKQAERWFANKTGAGAVKRMAALYEVIAEADASKQPRRFSASKESNCDHVIMPCGWRDYRLKVGRCTRSLSGTVSTG